MPGFALGGGSRFGSFFGKPGCTPVGGLGVLPTRSKSVRFAARLATATEVLKPTAFVLVVKHIAGFRGDEQRWIRVTNEADGVVNRYAFK